MQLSYGARRGELAGRGGGGKTVGAANCIFLAAWSAPPGISRCTCLPASRARSAVPVDAAKVVSTATPRTIERYTTHAGGTSFGTKFEGLKVSMDLPQQMPGLYHAGSVGIIMSGWLGTINYGVIVANKIDKALFAGRQGQLPP